MCETQITDEPAACPCGADHSAETPGRFYIAVESGSKFGLVAGPYETHAVALADIEDVRKLAESLDPWAWFYSFGTVRVPARAEPGILNDRLVEFRASRGV